MKILFFTHAFPSRIDKTSGIFNLHRVRSLIRNKCRVDVVAPISLTLPESYLIPFPNFKKMTQFYRIQSHVPKQDHIEGINIFHPRWFWLPRRFFWKTEINVLHLCVGVKMKKRIQTFQPDVIITSWIHPFGTYASFIKKYFKGPVLGIAEGSDLLRFPIKYHGYDWLENHLNQWCDRVVLVSNAMQEIVSRSMKLKRVAVVPNGFDEGTYIFSNRPEPGTHRKKIRLLSVGGLEHVKGHDLLLHAMTRLDKTYDLTIVGNGSLYRKYMAFIHGHHLEDRIRLIRGKSPSGLKKLIDHCHLLCMPSRSESFGIAALEAMACGRPVVGAQVGGLNDLIIDKFNGLKFHAESIDSLVKAIREATGIQWQYQDISDWAKSHYGWDKFGVEMMKIIREEIHQKSGF